MLTFKKVKILEGSRGIYHPAWGKDLTESVAEYYSGVGLELEKNKEQMDGHRHHNWVSTAFSGFPGRLLLWLLCENKDSYFLE